MQIGLDFKKSIVKGIQEGVPQEFLSSTTCLLEKKLNSFVSTGFSTSIFLSGTPGSGKSFCVKKAIENCCKNDIWCVTIDCRLFDTDKSACKEFLRQTNHSQSAPVLDVLKEMGTGIIVFDHFDSMKIIKRQFFLYTLFDSIHTNTISLCVVLITSSVEPLSNLEKRVKSRLTPQYISIPTPKLSDAHVMLLSLLTSSKLDDTQRIEWNQYVYSVNLEKMIANVFSISNSLHTIVTFAKKFVLLDQRLAINEQYMSSLSIQRFIRALSQLELLILFMSAYMMTMRGLQEFSFDQMFKELQEQSKSHSFLHNVRPDTAQLAWDKLVSFKFIIPIGKEKTKYAFALFTEDLAESINGLQTDHQKWVKTWM